MRKSRVKKLNSKGMTAVEILVCFVLVVIISVSMYTAVSSYQNKQQIEAYKEKIYTYKNLLTKEINSDLIKGGLVDAKIVTFNKEDATGDAEASVEMTFRDKKIRCLKVKSIKAYDYFWNDSMEDELPEENDKDDDFMISYGEGKCNSATLTEYPIPDLGQSKNPTGKIIYDLRINNVDMKIENSILYIYIGFYHPDLGTRYGIDIVSPINF